MTSILQIVQNAYREGNLIPIGEDPSGDQSTEGLFLLQNLISSSLGNEAGNPLTSITVGSNHIGSPTSEMLTSGLYSVPTNSRFNLTLSTAVTINLPPTPQDGARFAIVDTAGNLATYPLTINGNGCTIEGALSATINTNSVSREWFFRADIGDWRRVAILALTDDFPFPQEFNDLFITYLAIRLNPRSGVQTSEETMSAMKRSLSQFRARYYQNEPIASELGLLMTSIMRHRRYGSTSAFERGLPNPY